MINISKRHKEIIGLIIMIFSLLSISLLMLSSLDNRFFLAGVTKYYFILNDSSNNLRINLYIFIIKEFFSNLVLV